MRSLYIHIPFCKQKCIYCDFYSAIYDRASAGAYIDTIINELDATSGIYATAYIGGGTPSVLEAGLLEELIGKISGRLMPDAEFTVEVNPESVDPVKAALMAKCGVNRLSIGVQSLRDEKLKMLGRIHTAKRAEEAVAIAANCGFRNLSIDLMFGVWGEDVVRWEAELGRAARMPVTHISSYALTYEKGTPLADALARKSIEPLDDEAVGEMYTLTVEKLGLGGFKQYEVSNFAKTGYTCRHNMHYWQNGEYLGLGASAVSYIDGVRSKRVSNVGEYVKRYGAGRALIETSEKLTPIRRAKETAAVKIRTKEGIDFAWFRAATGYNFCELEDKAVKKLIDTGLVKYLYRDGLVTGIALRQKGFLFCDTVSSELL